MKKKAYPYQPQKQQERNGVSSVSDREAKTKAQTDLLKVLIDKDLLREDLTIKELILVLREAGIEVHIGIEEKE